MRVKLAIHSRYLTTPVFLIAFAACVSGVRAEEGSLTALPSTKAAGVSGGQMDKTPLPDKFRKVTDPGAKPAKVKVKKEKPKKDITVTSDRMETEKDKNLVVFIGNVVAEEDFFLCSDELTVNYGEDKEINDITAKGNVVIINEDKTAIAGQAFYDRQKRTVLLTVDPVVRRSTDTVRGDRITVFIDDDKAIVESDKEKSNRVKVVITPEKKKDDATVVKKPAQPAEVSEAEAKCRARMSADR